MRQRPNTTYALRAGVDLNTVAARKTCECRCGPQYTGSEKDLQTKERTRTVRNSAPTKSPIPSPSDSLFRGTFVTVPRRNTEPLGLRHCHTIILPVQTKMSHAMTEVCNTLCTHDLKRRTRLCTAERESTVYRQTPSASAGGNSFQPSQDSRTVPVLLRTQITF